MVAPRPSVLLVDDDVDMGRSLQRLAARRGLELFTVADRNDAMELLTQLGFDVSTIVVSYDLQHGEGRELLRELARRSPEIHRVVVGRGTDRKLAHVVREGLAHASVTKPVDMDEFVAALQPGAADRELVEERTSYAMRR